MAMKLLLRLDEKDYTDDMPVYEKHAVRAVIIRDGLLAMQLSGDGEYKIPGGTIEQGEDDAQALIREVREETGLVVDEASIAGMGEIEEVRQDRLCKGRKYVCHSRYYRCAVLPGTVGTQMTPEEISRGYRLSWASVGQIIDRNNRLLTEDWTLRDTKFIELMRDGLAGPPHRRWKDDFMNGKPIEKPVEGVFLDIGWTLNAPDGGDWWLTPKFHECAPAAASIAPERLEAALRPGKAYMDAHHRVDTEEEEYRQFLAFYTMLADNLPELGMTPSAIEAVAHDRVCNDANYLFFDDVPASLERLGQKYRLGIISDTWPSIDRVLRNAGIHRHFTAITYSFALGTYKPDPRLYAHALRSMGLPAARTVFVDDIEENLDGARAAGIQPVRIDRQGTADSGESRGGYPVVRDLNELEALLEG